MILKNQQTLSKLTAAETCIQVSHSVWWCGDYLSLVFAAPTFEGVGLKVGDADQSTEITDVHFVGIRHSEQSLVQKLCRTMCYLTVTLHLTETQTSITAGVKGQHAKTIVTFDLTENVPPWAGE